MKQHLSWWRRHHHTARRHLMHVVPRFYLYLRYERLTISDLPSDELSPAKSGFRDPSRRGVSSPQVFAASRRPSVGEGGVHARALEVVSEAARPTAMPSRTLQSTRSR
jgi:hypothetical protein